MRRSTLRSMPVALALAALLVASLGPSVMAREHRTRTGFDYIRIKDRLSQPRFPETTREALYVPMPDGEELYVEIVRPDPEAHGNGPWPVLMEASPYHGTVADRDGTRIFPVRSDEYDRLIGLTGYFAPRGYAVVMVDLRGTGRSTGCLDHLGQDDASDLKTIIEWAASQDWSNGRVGLTGHSYVGSTPSVAAAQDPQGLATIVPSAGLASMYDHQFNKGVPWLLQWVGPMVAYEGLAMIRDLPPGGQEPVLTGGDTGDNWENAPNPQFGCGWLNSSLTAGTGQATGQYEGWHAERDWREGAADADIPIFMIHGVNDNAARIPAAEWYFGDRGLRPGDKIWVGQWDHGHPANTRCGAPEGGRAAHPTCRFDQFKYALHAWFDRHLMGRNVRTGPAVEVFLNDQTPVPVNRILPPEEWGTRVLGANRWPLPTDTMSLYPDATDGSLKFAPPEEEGSATFSTLAEGVVASVGRGSVTFTSEPLARETLIAGLPELDLHASVTNEISHLTATLLREDADGNREVMNFCAIQPQMREGVETLAPVIPLQRMSLPMQCFTAAHAVPAGQRLLLQISTGTQHHAPYGPQPNNTVFTGPEATRYDLPRATRFQLREDVPLREPESGPGFPLGPAQEGFQESVIVPAPGAGWRIEPVTAVGVEFDINGPEENDNARLEALAVPTLVADLDLFLQELQQDGRWQTVASATTGDLSQELLRTGRQPEGRYRILIHNWAGGPEQVELTVTFFNQNDEPGGTGGDAEEAEGQIVINETYGGLLAP